MGIRTDNMVKFYQTRDQRTWVYGPGRDFTSPVKMDGVFYFGGNYIGVRNNNEVKFYVTNKQGSWSYSAGKDFVSPDDIDGVFWFLAPELAFYVIILSLFAFKKLNYIEAAGVFGHFLRIF